MIKTVLDILCNTSQIKKSKYFNLFKKKNCYLETFLTVTFKTNDFYN